MIDEGPVHKIQRFFLESSETKLHGRSSDLFLLWAPSRIYSFQWLRVNCSQHYLIGTYSSGTVQDLHLIPF